MNHKANKRSLRIFSWIALLSVAIFMYQCTEDPYEPDVTGTIAGIVKDAETDAPLPNVTITTQPATAEAPVTGQDGRYLISEVDTGQYSIVAEKADYDSKILSIKVKKNDTARVTVLLNPSDGSASSDITFEDRFMPGEGAQDQPIDPLLSWKAVDGTADDSLTYDVFLYRPDSPSRTLVAEGITDTSYRVDPLIYNSVYYWQVKAMDEQDDENVTYSRTLSFKTKGISDNSLFFVQKVDGDYEVMAYDFDREDVNPITFNNQRDWAPKLNPKSGRIAFVSDADVKPLIYTMDKNGGEIQQLSDDLAVNGYHNYGNAFDWDEKRGKIVFSHNRYLYEIDANGTNLQAITTAPANRHFREVEISPDGAQILTLTIGEKVYNSEIYLMDRNGSNKQVLIDNPPGIVQSPSWSIDGNSILYTQDVSGNESIDGRMLDSRIFRLNLSTMDTTALSQNKSQGTNDMHPRYSPTGAQIVFTNAPNDDSQPPRIMIMGDDGESREELVEEGRLPFWK